VVIGKLDTEKQESLSSVICMEPAIIPIQGVHSPRVLTRIQTKLDLQLTSLQGRIVSEAPRDCAYVIITNSSSEALTVPKATILSIAEEISEIIVDKINRGQSSFDFPTESHSGEKNKALFQKLLKGKLDHLPPHERQLI
jgi:hypothetical protein